MLFSSSICTCQLPPFEASASGFAMPFAFKLLSAEVSCSGVSGGLTPLLSRTFLLYQSAFPRWTFTGTDQTSPFELTMSLRSLGILLSHPSEFQMLVMASILLEIGRASCRDRVYIGVVDGCVEVELGGCGEV